MSERQISSQVEVAVDAGTAFRAFTEEMDLWWVRGPINFYDASRAIALRCEPGIGGRLLEVYDDASGEALELGRITAWQPGELLAWNSSVDDVQTEVRFVPKASGTTVTVTATVPVGGADRGGTSWVRVVPGWLGAWAARRDTAPRQPDETGRLGLAVYYAKPPAAARWLAHAFGFIATNPLPDDDADPRRTWIEFHIGNCSVMLFPLDGDHVEDAPVTHEPWVFVDDLDAHIAQARASGATIVSDIHQHGYRAYQAADLEGHRWTFTQARPTQRP
jgi:uncharacterized glyoxalase superfamily protein PhnB